MALRTYFAFGSNLFEARLRARIPAVKLLGSGSLAQHQLRFHKRHDLDGSGKCDAYYTGKPHDIVFGRLYLMSAAEEAILDQYEGLGHAYYKKPVQIKPIQIATANSETAAQICAFTYYANPAHLDPNAVPYTWYKQHVLAGARQGGFPPEYIAKIEAVLAQPDPDATQEKRELAIHAN